MELLIAAGGADDDVPQTPRRSPSGHQTITIDEGRQLPTRRLSTDYLLQQNLKDLRAAAETQGRKNQMQG